MPNCPFCDTDTSLDYRRDDLSDHLIVLRSDSGHIHVHGPVNNKDIMLELIMAIAKEAGFEIEIEDRSSRYSF